MSDQPKCNLCGEPMPPGEEMFKFHGYSGPCPTKPMPAPHVIERRSVPENRHYAAVKHVDLDALEAELAQAKAERDAAEVYARRQTERAQENARWSQRWKDRYKSLAGQGTKEHTDKMSAALSQQTQRADAALALLREFIELCAAGDVDEDTEVLGWGDLIRRAKEMTGGSNG